ncbi:MAG: HDOD domain-containing protein, partial [Sedimenticola sp.]|nr:HDOD domain-containing protein [Sedimenticola sp.]
MSVDQDKLERLVEKMPTFPQSAQRVMEICADINYSTPELVSVIEKDPIITLKVLKLVNSAYFGLSKKITSIKHSVVYVGSNTIKNIAVAITTIGILPKVAEAGISRTNFLTHSLTTAVLARLIGRTKGVAENELTNFYIAGLLHDIG